MNSTLKRLLMMGHRVSFGGAISSSTICAAPSTALKLSHAVRLRRPSTQWSTVGVRSTSQLNNKVTTVNDQSTTTSSVSSSSFDESRWRTTIKSMTTASGIVDMCPSNIQPYLRLMRFDKPVGSWLLFWPCAWSIGLATTAGDMPDLYLLALVGIGSLIMRSAGCIVNDMWDRDFDSKVERTKSRPIASGEINTVDAFTFLAVILTFGDFILMQFNTSCILLGVSVAGLVTIYPLMKRVFNWPQLFLGLTFNWGALFGWTAVHISCDLTVCLPLYLGCIAWTLVYDTIYAHQDKKDDVKIGIKSTAVLMGSNTKVCLMGFTSVMSVGFLTAGIVSEQTLPYYLAIALATGHVVHQIWTLNIDNAEDCSNTFESNNLLGFIIMAGIIASVFVKKKKAGSSTSSDGGRTQIAPIEVIEPGNYE